MPLAAALAYGKMRYWSLHWNLPSRGSAIRRSILSLKKKRPVWATLIANHAFVDGNKRIGIFVMLVFLSVNGVEWNLTNEDVIQAGLGVADGPMEYGDLLRWVQEHRV